MNSRWLAGTLLGLAFTAGTAYGQQGAYIPTPYGSARLPEPTPISRQLPSMVGGPLNPYTAPAGPPDSLSLPANHASAFQAENYVREQAFYVHAGGLYWQRQGYQDQLFALLDPINLKNGVVTPGSTPLINLHDVTQHPQGGVTATIGYLWENRAIELTGSYLFTQNLSNQYRFPGQIDGFYFNPPLGFEGDNGMWTHADLMTIQHTTSMINVEANYRYTSEAFTDFDMIFGLRYTNFKDQFNNFTGDDDLTFLLPNGQTDPVRQALYRVSSTNQIVSTQIGCEYDKVLYKFLSLGFTAKTAAGVNYAQIQHRLTRGDGFVGFDDTRTKINPIVGLFDVSAFAELHLTEKCRIRGGYNFFYLLGVSRAENQINFDLANHNEPSSTNGGVYFHGPSLELQILY